LDASRSQRVRTLVFECNASYRAKKAASTSPGFCHLGSTRRRGSPNGQALARAYKTFASFTSSGTIASRGLSTRRFRAHSALRLIKTNNSGKHKTSSPLRDVVAISSPPLKNDAALCATVSEFLLTHRWRSSRRQREHREPPPPTKIRTGGTSTIVPRWNPRCQRKLVHSRAEKSPYFSQGYGS
jgi:hypothetical protein